MNSVDPMIFFSNILLIHQLLCANTDIKEGDDGSEYVYTEEKFRDNLEHIEDGPKEHLDLRRARIAERLLSSSCGTLLERATMEKYKGLQIFYREFSKAVRFVYEAEKFSLYFSAQQEDDVGPMEGLKVSINKSSIEKAKDILKRFNRVHLKIMVSSSSQNLSDVDLGDTMQQFDFITDLYLLNSTHKYTSSSCKSCKTVQDFINLEKVPKLRTLEVMHMLVKDEFLEKVSNMTLESLNFTGCIFLTSKDTVQKRGEIEVAFGKSYETICFNKCQEYSHQYQSHNVGRMHCIAIKINLNNCVKLRNLTIKMDEYASVIPSKQIVSGLRYLSLDNTKCKLLLSPSQCYGTRLEYLVIGEKPAWLAIEFLRKINRNELKHLVLIYNTWDSTRYICDVYDLFNLDFAALEVLEIDASGNNLGLSGSTSGIKMKKLETLKINCGSVNEALMQMITELETLKRLEIFMSIYADVNYELVWRQLRNLKGPIEVLVVSSKLAISESVRSIEPLNTLKEFYISGRSIRASSDSLANQNDCDKVNPNEQNLVKSKNIVRLKLHTLNINMNATCEKLIALILRGDFEAFADIKKLVIEDAPPLSEETQVSSKSMQKQLSSLIKSFFETFKQLEVLVISYKSFSISEEEADNLRKLFSLKCKLVKERCKWSDKCNEERTTFELYN